MTTNCELCGRGTAQKALTPTWYPHTVCDREGCRAAARDAVQATLDTREHYDDLAGAIAERHGAQMVACGWRSDTMAKIDVVEDRDWWANSIAKRV